MSEKDFVEKQRVKESATMLRGKRISYLSIMLWGATALVMLGWRERLCIREIHESTWVDNAPLSFEMSGQSRLEETRREEGPSTVALVGFNGMEGSSWMMDALAFTQKLSTDGKICVMGYEPLEGPKPGNWSAVTEGRKMFYEEFTNMENDSPESFQGWVNRLNAILTSHGFNKLWPKCDFRSRVFIFKTRIGYHFNSVTGDLTAEESVWLENFREKFQARQGKVIQLSRHNVLARGATHVLGQFLLKDAKNEEERQAILRRFSSVEISPASVVGNASLANAATWRLSNFLQTLGVPTLLMTYENLLRNFEQEMSILLRFLDVPIDYDVKLLANPGTFEKVSPDRLCKKVKDYKALCEYVRTTQFAGLLDDPCDTSCEP